jgi:hypothetical protein
MISSEGGPTDSNRVDALYRQLQKNRELLNLWDHVRACTISQIYIHFFHITGEYTVCEDGMLNLRGHHGVEGSGSASQQSDRREHERKVPGI